MVVVGCVFKRVTNRAVCTMRNEWTKTFWTRVEGQGPDAGKQYLIYLLAPIPQAFAAPGILSLVLSAGATTSGSALDSRCSYTGNVLVKHRSMGRKPRGCTHALASDCRR